MRPLVLVLSFLVLLAAPAARAEVGIDLHLRFGDPVPPPVRIVEPPLFLYPPSLGFYVAVGVPYDVFYLGGRYYLPRGDRWYVALHYGGPWYHIPHRHLPPGLVKHSLNSIRHHRDFQYRAYRENRGHYGRKTFRPGPPGHAGKPGHPGKGRGKGR